MSKAVLFNKYSSVYSCPDDINNFKIRLRIKEIRQNNDESETSTNFSRKWFKKTIKWQEKLFNKYEREFYGNIKNCISDLDKKYHELVKGLSNIDEDDFLISTLVEGDEMLPTYSDQNLLKSNFVKFDVDEQNNDEDADENDEKEFVFDMRKSLENSFETPYLHKLVKNMQIIVDFGHYVQDNWLKNEKVICTVEYDTKMKALSIYPDFNANNDPYEIKINEGTKMKTYRYYLENASPEVPEEILLKEEELISKIIKHKSFIRNQSLPNNFSLPPKDKLYIYLFMEIESVTNIENIPSYVQYFIDLPSGWHSSEEQSQLKGITQLSYAKLDDSHNNRLYYGYCFDLTLEYNIKEMNNKIPEAPCIYFEIISKDYWDRFRTEGLAYKTLPISKPGVEKCQLQCFRFKSNRLDGELKRFFIGDCGNYDDITWIGIPKDQEGRRINKFGINTVGTGQLDIKINVVHQSQAFLPEYNDDVSSVKDREKFIFDKLNSSRLIQSVEMVLKAFRKARKRMLEAKKNV